VQDNKWNHVVYALRESESSPQGAGGEYTYQDSMKPIGSAWMPETPHRGAIATAFSFCMWHAANGHIVKMQKTQHKKYPRRYIHDLVSPSSISHSFSRGAFSLIT